MCWQQVDAARSCLPKLLAQEEMSATPTRQPQEHPLGARQAWLGLVDPAQPSLDSSTPQSDDTSFGLRCSNQLDSGCEAQSQMFSLVRQEFRHLFVDLYLTSQSIVLLLAGLVPVSTFLVELSSIAVRVDLYRFARELLERAPS